MSCFNNTSVVNESIESKSLFSSFKCFNTYIETFEEISFSQNSSSVYFLKKAVELATDF